MRIIDIKNRLQSYQLLRKAAMFIKAHFIIAFLAVIFICSIYGCIKPDDSANAKKDAERSDYYYQQAVAQYKTLLTKADNSAKTYFDLGMLYYSHGDFENALSVLKKAKEPKAEKFIAISYYRLGQFTDALEVFDKMKTEDAESLYYKGLTEEKLNLFDRALATYKNIKVPQFKSLAEQRLDIIEKDTLASYIKDVDSDIYNIISAAPKAENYPQAGGLILYCDEQIEVNSEYNQISQMHYLVKILNQRGREDFSEIQIEYDSTYEKIELEYARTIKPDGEVINIGLRHIRNVSKYLNFPLYSNVRVFIISFPEITDGSCIEYKLKIKRNQLINKKDFVLSYPVQAQEPVIRAKFTVKIPDKTKINMRFLNQEYNSFKASLEPKVEKINGYKLYKWDFSDIPQIIPEPSMPPDTEINTTMLISTFDSWQEIYNWWWALARDKIAPSDAIKDKVKDLIKGLKPPEDQIRAIYNFCAKDIRYVAVEYGQAGYEPHRAEDIFRNKYGDCKDQAVLLVTMLREAGFSAYLVLIPTDDYYNLNESFPAVLFNHCIACVDFNGNLIFLDPTAQTCSFGDLPQMDQDRSVLIFKDSGYLISRTPFYPAKHNSVEQIINIKVNNDESINASKTALTYGRYDQSQRFWLLYTPPELVEQALKEAIQKISIGAKLEGYNTENVNDLNKPVILKYSFYGSEYFTQAGNLRILPQLGGLDTASVAKDSRKYPLDAGVLYDKEDVVEIQLPQGFAVKYMPGSVEEDNPWMNFIFRYDFKNNKLRFTQKIVLKKRIITQNDYPAFKRLFEELAKKVKQRVVLERIK